MPSPSDQLAGLSTFSLTRNEVAWVGQDSGLLDPVTFLLLSVLLMALRRYYIYFLGNARTDMIYFVDCALDFLEIKLFCGVQE